MVQVQVSSAADPLLVEALHDEKGLKIVPLPPPSAAAAAAASKSAADEAKATATASASASASTPASSSSSASAAVVVQPDLVVGGVTAVAYITERELSEGLEGYGPKLCALQPYERRVVLLQRSTLLVNDHLKLQLHCVLHAGLSPLPVHDPQQAARYVAKLGRAATVVHALPATVASSSATGKAVGKPPSASASTLPPLTLTAAGGGGGGGVGVTAEDADQRVLRTAQTIPGCSSAADVTRLLRAFGSLHALGCAARDDPASLAGPLQINAYTGGSGSGKRLHHKIAKMHRFFRKPPVRGRPQPSVPASASADA